MYFKIITLDTSGNGTTGISILECVGNKSDEIIDNNITNLSISIKDFINENDYFNNIINFLDSEKNDHLIIEWEKYIEYQNNATMFQNLSTPRLNQILLNYCKNNNIEFIDTITASQIKTRWSNNVLTLNKFIKDNKLLLTNYNNEKKLNKHELDSFRHLCHTYYFKIDNILNKWYNLNKE